VLVTFDGAVHTFPDAVGVGVVDKGLFKNGFDHIAQGVVYHPVSERRGADEAFFGVEHIKSRVRAGLVGLGLEFVLEAEEFFVQVEFKSRHGRVVVFTFRSCIKRRQKVGRGCDAVKQVIMASHQSILIVNKTADFLKFLVPVLSRFPKDQRFLLADRIQQNLMETLELFVKAYYSPPDGRAALLREANISIEKIRQYFRICFELGYYNSIKYNELSQKLNELGNMNGGWLRSLKT
jgi:23S rRNA-intervening sequence protein